MTIFLTTHYMEETDAADRVVILDHGKILCDDTPAGLKTNYSARRLLWYTPKSEKNDEVINSFAGADKITYMGDRYVATIKGDASGFLYENRDKVTDYELLKGSMDDVFLNLTGRELA